MNECGTPSQDRHGNTPSQDRYMHEFRKKVDYTRHNHSDQMPTQLVDTPEYNHPDQIPAPLTAVQSPRSNTVSVKGGIDVDDYVTTKTAEKTTGGITKRLRSCTGKAVATASKTPTPRVKTKGVGPVKGWSKHIKSLFFASLGYLNQPPSLILIHPSSSTLPLLTSTEFIIIITLNLLLPSSSSHHNHENQTNSRRAPPFNQNRSPPRFRNPSPPPSSSLPLNLKPLRTLFPPYYDQPPPNPVQTPLNQNQTPPHLKPKSKKKPSFSAPPRRSQRLRENFANQKTQSNAEKVYINCDSTEEDETDEEEIDICPSSKSYSNPSSDSSSEETKFDSSIPIQPQSEKGKEKVHGTTSNKSKNRTQKEKSVNALSKDETPLFSSETEESIFQEKWRTKPIAPGRFFNFEALKSHPLEIKAYTDFQGWSSFLSLKETYYPRLIQAFYFKAKCDRENSTIRTKVKGVEFELNPDIIADIFKIPNNGFNAYGKNWYSLARTTFEEVRIPLFNLDASKNSRKTSDLNFLPKVFHIITQGSVLPRQGNNEDRK
ncbi:unnamed protein product [Trifolium pratense]|uniref:Uncharacterized protein n=1 Tax=Trifolium pratense TaxID=57577 RepID=A0ACB0ISU1_TRIPR|nr:unnamed protein product [Trifolium pratense]